VVVSSNDGRRLYTLNVPDNWDRGRLPAWAPDESGIDYVATQNGVSNIWRQPLTGDPPVQITNFNAGIIFSFAWSRDGRWLSLTTGLSRSDAVIMSRN
jgi:Tol biopolymer transport system component